MFCPTIPQGDGITQEVIVGGTKARGLHAIRKDLTMMGVLEEDV